MVYNLIVKPYLSYDGSGVPVGGHAKVAPQTEDGVAHVSYIYLMNTYINVYNDMYGVLGLLPVAARLLLVFATRTMKNYDSIQL